MTVRIPTSNNDNSYKQRTHSTASGNHPLSSIGLQAARSKIRLCCSELRLVTSLHWAEQCASSSSSFLFESSRNNSDTSLFKSSTCGTALKQNCSSVPLLTQFAMGFYSRGQEHTGKTPTPSSLRKAGSPPAPTSTA